jgi:hypothetical protein
MSTVFELSAEYQSLSGAFWFRALTSLCKSICQRATRNQVQLALLQMSSEILTYRFAAQVYEFFVFFRRQRFHNFIHDILHEIDVCLTAHLCYHNLAFHFKL